MDAGNPPMHGFEEFIGLFLAAGKPVNPGDVIQAQAKWVTLNEESKLLAFQDARQQLMRTRDARYMPLPANYLAARPWTRTAPARTLPYIDPKTEKALDTHSEVSKLLEEKQKRKTG